MEDTATTTPVSDMVLHAEGEDHVFDEKMEHVVEVAREGRLFLE